MTRTLSTIQEIQKELDSLSENKSLAQAQRVILSVIRLLDDSVSVDDTKNFELFNVDNQKISANAQWFYEDAVVVDRRATYKIHAQNNLNIDFKLYGLTKPSKRTISWIQALTPNFEDEPFNSKYNLGIDFVVPKSADRIIIVLSNSYVIRTLELKGALTATYQEVFSKWASISDFSNKKEVHSILWESFDLQPLNKKFYAGISERFITLRQHLTKEDVLDEKHASLFANRLLGRVIFCWFLDKKGIINADKKYFDSESFESDTEYYRTKLENLFFGVLNTPIPDREYKDEVTPFLNGGLFEARDTDLYKDSKLSFPKNYFDDLFGFLSGYNFTTDESTSQFQQVAIDPEMLGRIFENLLAEMTEEDGGQARKAKGAFYTPREIVDYMCRESLREYLKTKLPEDEHRDQRLEQLIDRPDKEFQDQDHNWRRDWKPYKDSIIKALDELKVLDPACGSGAFPIGMLQLLVRVYERLEARFDPYRTKLQVIEKNIYGVDIEPMAVEIARLRTWLSIIVDEEADSKKIKPLPNLEFKFVCANSLIDLDKSGQETLYEMEPDLENKLRDIRDAYFNTESVAKKKKLKAEYEKLVNVGEGLFGASEKSKQLKTYRPFDNETTASFFNSEFMFGVEKFDVVIGNPPYGAKISKEAVEILKPRFKHSIKGKVESYRIFMEEASLLCEKEGIVALIVPNTWMYIEQALPLREFLLKNTAIKILASLPQTVFTATVDSMVIVWANSHNEINRTLTFSIPLKDNVSDISAYLTNGKYVDQSDWLDSEKFIFTVGEDKFVYDLIAKIKKTNDSFSKYIYTKQGLIPYLTKEEGKENKYISKEKINENWDPYFDGSRCVDRYSTKGKISYIKYGDWLYAPREKELFNQPRIIFQLIRNISLKRRIVATYLETKIYSDRNTGLIFTKPDAEVNLKYVLGLLNSNLINFIHSKSHNSTYISFPSIESLPFVLGTKEEQEKVVSLVERIIDRKKKAESVEDLEIELEDLIANLYGLTDEEKKIIYDQGSK